MAAKRRFSPPDEIGSIADATVSSSAAIIVPIDLTRDTVTITNTDASVAMRVGDSAITASRGYRVGAGQSFTTECTADIYAISEGADVTAAIGFTSYAAG